MKKQITIRGDYIEIEIDGLKTHFPLSEIIVHTERGSFRADYLIKLGLYASDNIDTSKLSKKLSVNK